MADGDPKEEYKDLSDNLRYYGGSRFVHLTLYITILAVLFNAVFSSNPQFSATLRIALKVFGILTTITFLIIEQRGIDYWRHFLLRAIELEVQLGYKQYSVRPTPTWSTLKLNATWATRLLYLFTLIFWLASLFLLP